MAALRDVWLIESGGLDRLTSAGVDVPAEQVTTRRRQVRAGSLATIVYTSGTTGRPKGCAITHANLLSEVGNVSAAPGVDLVLGDTKSTLLFLPLAHILARMIQLSTVQTCTRLGHTSDLADLPARLAEFRPTSVLSVPRVFEKIYNTAQHRATTEGHGRIFAVAEAVATRYSETLDAGGRPSLLLRARRAVCDRLVYSKLRQAMGGRVEYAVSGGAPLGARLGHFFRGAGVNVLEGYGLTETCAGATLNLPGAQRVGSVGRPIPGCTLRIAPDGEVLIKGGQVFQGYWHNESATREVFDDEGWFRSGDLGEIDEDGFLTITGRKKDLIVTSSGKNVAPAVLEDRLRAHWLVSQCVVVGDARPYIGALVTIDLDVFGQWKREHGKPDLATVADLHEDPDLLAEIKAGVDDANLAVSAAESIKRFLVLSGEFTVAGGELTPTLKVKRNVIFKSFKAELEALYSRPS